MKNKQDNNIAGLKSDKRSNSNRIFLLILWITELISDKLMKKCWQTAILVLC